jgi:hypothetical protein
MYQVKYRLRWIDAEIERLRSRRILLWIHKGQIVTVWSSVLGLARGISRKRQ